MRVRALDADHDWTFGKGQNNYLSRNAAVVQNIDTRLNSFLGNCFFDNGAGIDWFSYLGGSKDTGALSLAISSIILKTTDVTGIRQLSISLVNRQLIVRYRVQTSYSAPSGQFQLDLNEVAF